MSSNTRSGGVSLPLVLFVVFLVLKLTDLINWSWWWVTSPLWIPTNNPVGIHSGAVTHHQDQLIRSVSLSTRNTTNSTSGRLTPPLRVLLDIIHLHFFNRELALSPNL